jgi:hypothetical protein
MWCAGPSQAKVLTGGGALREAQVDIHQSVSHTCVLPLDSNRGTCLLERFEVRLRAMTDLTKEWCLGGNKLVMGGIIWLVGWVLSPDWLIRKPKVCDFC